MKKKLFTLLLVTSIIFIVPVFAKGTVSIEKLTGTTKHENVILNDAEKVDVSFNDLKQDATYKVELKNTTEDILYVNDLVVENLSENFVDFSLTDKSFNAALNPGTTKEIEFVVSTLDITGAGRNVNDEVKLMFILGDSIKNPVTSSELLILYALILILLITGIFTFKKINKKTKLTILIISLMLVGTTYVSAKNVVNVELTGKVTYTSQNLMQESGNVLEGYKVNYENSSDIWKHSNEIKNIIILDDKTKINKYNYMYDLSINNSRRIYGYLIESGDEKIPYDLYIVANGIIYAPKDSTGLFSFPNVETIKGLEYIEFKDTTNMAAMFLGNEKLHEANVKSINMTNAITTAYMFNGCDELNVSEKTFDLSHVINKDYMFNQKLNSLVKNNAISDKDINFKNSPTSGTYYIESTKNDINPVYYYRGTISNNNVLFAGFCWKIVRTTDTGGTKLIYNGIPSENGHCDNTGTASQLSTNGKFNLNYNSPAYVGYMYGTAYPYKVMNLKEQTKKILYGNSFIWDGNKYTLTDTKSSSSWKNDRTALAVKYHYTCFNATGQCSTIYYVHHYKSETDAYYLELNDGKDIETAKEEMFSNENDSEMKRILDEWYEMNLISYTNDLEDTIWCNDREFANGALYSKDYDTGTLSSFFASYDRNFNTHKPSIVCSNKNDSFTVNNNKGNTKLKYPVGLLTADEYNFAGSGYPYYNTDSYLFTGENQWSLSPCCFNDKNAYEINLYPIGNLYSNVSSYTKGIRPSISLKTGINYVAGTGTVNDPYIIE